MKNSIKIFLGLFLFSLGFCFGQEEKNVFYHLDDSGEITYSNADGKPFAVYKNDSVQLSGTDYLATAGKVLKAGEVMATLDYPKMLFNGKKLKFREVFFSERRTRVKFPNSDNFIKIRKTDRPGFDPKLEIEYQLSGFSKEEQALIWSWVYLEESNYLWGKTGFDLPWQIIMGLLGAGIATSFL